VITPNQTGLESHLSPDLLLTKVPDNHLVITLKATEKIHLLRLRQAGLIVKLRLRRSVVETHINTE
jgi:hypothetical protein